MDGLSERRAKRRFVLTRTVHFRLSAKRPTSRWGSGTVHDISSGGINFHCRRQLPLGSHLELIVDWPSPLDHQRIVSLHASGFVVRSSSTRTAVRITSHRFRIADGSAVSFMEAAIA